METHWHREVLPHATAQILRDPNLRAALAKEGLDRSYLAGGTGLALYLGHRVSEDLDLFHPELFNEDLVLQRLASLPSFSLTGRAPSTIHAVSAGVKLSFLGYAYPLLYTLRDFNGIPVADPRDIACMKLSAIAGRGARRDFVDLYFACREFEFPKIIDLFSRKYARVNYSRIHILKSLTFFTHAETEPMPAMLAPLDWDDVTGFFLRAAATM